MSRDAAGYEGDRYLSWDEIAAWCEHIAERAPEWVELSEIGRSREGRPILLLSIGSEGRDERPAVWIDGGTHASEFTGVMAALHTVETWVRRLEAGEPEAQRTFRRQSAYVAPCISPDGYAHMHGGGPFIRSSLRPPRDGAPRQGFEPCDIDGDGVIRFMRWAHPAGPFVPDERVPSLMRPRTLDDDPADAFFFCEEGHFLNWDGLRWTAATLRNGLDLNRNFPSGWAPFSMFGMDGGAFALSEPESRAIADAVRARPYIGAALTNHTYTGCILTQPYSADSPLSNAEIRLLDNLAHDLVADSGYRVFKVYPDFVYDPKQRIVGVWADTLCTVFGIPGYTMEFWDPFAFAGVTNERPAAFFLNPDIERIRDLLGGFYESSPELVHAWSPVEHPQLGPVEVGGIDYLRTIRNPPESLLRAELEIGRRAADRLLRSLPSVEAELEVRWHDGDLAHLSVSFENLGYLSTCGLHAGAECPGVSATVQVEGSVELVGGVPARVLDHIDGWGSARASSAKHPIYPSLARVGHRNRVEWWVQGTGRVRITWTAGRAGRGEIVVDL